MLHPESWKDSAKGYLALTSACISLLLATACTELQKETEAEIAANQRLQLINDSAQDAKSHLGLIISLEQDSLEADIAVNDYYNNGGQWMWVTEDTTMLLQTADSMASFLKQQATDMGFTPDAFFADSIKSGIAHMRDMDFDSTGVSPVHTMAALELNLSRAFIRYARGQRYGFVNPEELLNHIDLKNGGGYRRVYDIDLEQPGDSFTADALAHAASPVDYLRSLEPDDDIYRQLKQKLAADSTTEGRHRIVCNMERIRWRHKNHIGKSDRHIFVNIPSQHLWAITPDSVFSMRICCGAWNTKTPLLESNIKLIQLNPEWRIPATIVRSEVSRHGGDSAYFARNRYFIIKNSTGDTVAAKHVSAEQLRAGGYRVTQRSGRGNSLGRIIFRFPNQFDVYLHDTNNHGAFNADRRTVSHGCVRVQRPFDLVKFCMPYATEEQLDRMRMSIDMKPETEWGKKYLAERDPAEGPVRLVSNQSLQKNIPLQIDYYTYYPNPETGVWETWPDRYEYDKQIVSKIKPFMP